MDKDKVLSKYHDGIMNSLDSSLENITGLDWLPFEIQCDE